MPTLLQIGSSSNYGAPGKITEQIGLLAVKYGWKCYVAHGPRQFNPSKLNAFKVNSRFDEIIHGAIYSLLLDSHGLGSVNATKRLIKKIDNEIKPDIIHLHNLHGYFINYKILFDYLASVRIPIVWTLHDCWTFTGHCAYFTLSKCNKWQYGCNRCVSIHDYPKSLFYDRSARNFEDKKQAFTTKSLDNLITLVPVSDWLAKNLQRSFLNKYPIKVIHNGIDLDIFTPRNTSYLSEKLHVKNKFIILGVANPWNPRKGFFDWIKLRSLLSNNYIMILVGLSKKQISVLPKGIIGIESTQNALELADYYSVANVFLNTTYEDNYPTVNLEAIACGTPVITYNTGGSPESITSETGYVVSTGNLSQVIEAIHSLERKDITQVRSLCRSYAENHFDKRFCFQQYIELYNTILKS